MCDEFIRETKQKNTFLLILRVLGWSMLLDLDWWSQKFTRMDGLARKKIAQPLLSTSNFS